MNQITPRVVAAGRRPLCCTGTTPPVVIDPPPVDEAAFIAYAKALPEDHMTHQWMSVAESNAIWALVPRSQVTHVAVNNGNFSDPNTWDTDTVPGAGAKVLISVGKTVTYDVAPGTAQAGYAITWIRNDGTLIFPHNLNLELTCDTIIQDDELGVWREGSVTQPVQADKVHKFNFLGDTDIDIIADNFLFGRGLIAGGIVEMCGAKKTAFVRPTAHPMAGAQSMTLQKSPVGWRVGDKLLITPTRHRGVLANRAWLPHWTDEATLLTVSGVNITFTTHPNGVTPQGLLYNHNHDGGIVDEDGNSTTCHIGNLTRNIEFTTPEGGTWPTVPHRRRGHIMFMHTPWIDVRFTMATNLGRTRKDVRSFPATRTKPVHRDQPGAVVYDEIVPHTSDSNVQGRYPYHLHRTGLAMELSCPVTGDVICGCNKSMLQGNVAWNTQGWGFAHHAGNANLFDNIAYNCFGAGFVAETGEEVGAWYRNLSVPNMRGRRDITEKDTASFASGNVDLGMDGGHYGIDSARGASGYWFGGRSVKVFDSVAAACTFGFVWMPRKLSGLPVVSLQPKPEIFYIPSGGALVPGGNVIERPPIIRASYNDVYACYGHSIVIKEQPDQQHSLRTVMRNLHGFELGHGLDLTYTGHYTVKDCCLQCFNPTVRGAFNGYNESVGYVFAQNAVDMVGVNLKAKNFVTGLIISEASNNTNGAPLHALINHSFTGQDISIKLKYHPTYFPYNIPDLLPVVEDHPTWLVVKSTAQIVPGRLTYQRGNNTFQNAVWPTVGTGKRFDRIGVFTDNLGTRQRFQSGIVQCIPADGTLQNYQIFIGYYTTAAGHPVGLVYELISDRVTGNYMELTIPYYYANTFEFNNLKKNPLFINRGALPAQYEPMLDISYVYDAANYGLQNHAGLEAVPDEEAEVA